MTALERAALKAAREYDLGDPRAAYQTLAAAVRRTLAAELEADDRERRVQSDLAHEYDSTAFPSSPTAAGL